MSNVAVNENTVKQQNVEADVVNDALEKIKKAHEEYDKIKLHELNRIKSELSKNKNIKINKKFKTVVSDNDLERTLKLNNISDIDNHKDYGWNSIMYLLDSISSKRSYKIQDFESKYGCLKDPINMETLLVHQLIYKVAPEIDVKYIKEAVVNGLRAQDLNKRMLSYFKKSKNKTITLKHIQNKIIIDKLVSGKIKIKLYKNDINEFCKTSSWLNSLITDQTRFDDFVKECPVDFMEDILQFINYYKNKLVEICDANKLDWFKNELEKAVSV